MCGYCGCDQTAQANDVTTVAALHGERTLVQIEQDILAVNKRYAAANRAFLKQHGILALNIVSSPGTGKTTLLVNTLKLLKDQYTFSVIEGDQQTDRDAQRIAKTQVAVQQINTGKMCHLDAHRIQHALEKLLPPDDSIVFIENIGNLVCPALFDLGEAAKVVLLSVTEGDDKPLKYPDMFNQARLMIINKIDLLPYVEFDLDACIRYAKQINPKLEVVQVSANDALQLKAWLTWLEDIKSSCRAIV